MIRVWLRIIAVLEIIGGSFGIVLMVWVLLTNPIEILNVAVAMVAIAVYVLSLAGGIALWRGLAFGRTASIIVQVIQLPKIISPAFIMIFSFGFDVWVHYLLAGGASALGVEFRCLAFNQLFFNMDGAPTGFGISVPSLVFLPILLRYKPLAKAEESLALPPPPPEWDEDRSI